ncbi:MAG: citrate transporter, partial [Treponemataceae bacterium]|nr:citrate transporter [Treponemataceae bacterium]
MALKWVVLGIAVLMYALVILFQEKKVWFTSAAALVVVLLGTVFPAQIFLGEGRAFALLHSLGALINWNVLM